MANVKWTVSILLQYYDEDWFAYELLKNDILAQTNYENVKYYIFKYNVIEDIIDILTIKIESERSVLYTDKQILHCQDFYDNPEKYWQSFFDEYAVSQDAEYNFLMTCGHGAGFGFVTRDKLPESFRINKKAKKRYDYLKKIFSTGAIGFNKEKLFEYFIKFFDEKKLTKFQERAFLTSGFHIIPIEKLTTVLQTTFKKPIEFWYARNCYMQMFESGYILKSQVKYLVGSENFVFNLGLDYKKLFNELGDNQHGENHLRSLANNMCTNLPLRYQNEAFLKLLKRRKIPISGIKFISQSINNLHLYGLVKDVINEIANHFLNNKTLYITIRAVREECKDISMNPYGIIDLVNFCKKLHPQTTDLKLREMLERFIELITNEAQNVIIAKHFPTEVYSSARLAICPYGVSIFFPEDKKISENDQYINFFMTNFYTQRQDFNNDFLKDSTWPSFILDYYNHSF